MKNFKNIILFSTFFFITLIFGEIYLRGTRAVGVSMAQYYDDIGKGYRRDFNYVQFREGFSIGKINAERYLGDLYPKDKQKDSYRISLLGDSYAEGTEVFQRNHFKSYIENNLIKNQYKKIEVLNFGRHSFNFPNMFAYQKLLVNQFNSDIVLYFISSHDLIDRIDDPSIPNTILRNDSLSIISECSSQVYLKSYKTLEPIVQNSTLVSMVNNSRRKLKNQGYGSLFIKASNKEISYLKDTDDTDFPEVINRLFDSLDNNVIIVWRDISEMPNNLKILFNKYGISYLSLSPLLQELQSNNQNPFYWKATNKYGHWNKEAHKKIGLFLSKALSD